ncbi:MAG: mycofactocin precursor MftA [Streptosporangiaceae bacterium]|jgi:mycofactocin precursor
MSERVATTQEPAQDSEPDLADGPELLVEEVSIDGMCGVY